MSDAFDFPAYIEASMEGLRLQTDAHEGTWGISRADWSVDQDLGLITWRFPDGRMASAAVQIVGTYSTADGSFLWGWDHPSVYDDIGEHARLALAFGEEHEIERLTTRKLYITTAEAWELTAVTNRVAGANGAYRGDTGETLVFMTFGDVGLSGPEE